MKQVEIIKIIQSCILLSICNKVGKMIIIHLYFNVFNSWHSTGNGQWAQTKSLIVLAWILQSHSDDRSSDANKNVNMRNWYSYCGHEFIQQHFSVFISYKHIFIFYYLTGNRKESIFLVFYYYLWLS